MVCWNCQTGVSGCLKAFKCNVSNLICITGEPVKRIFHNEELVRTNLFERKANVKVICFGSQGLLQQNNLISVTATLRWRRGLRL